MYTVTRALTAFAGAVLIAALGACEARGDDVRDEREPDAVGSVESTLGTGESVAVRFAPDPGYEYFEGTTFEFAKGSLETGAGEVASSADVHVGDRIEVWVEACAESFPVQCADPVGRLVP